MKPYFIIFLFITYQLSGQLKKNFENSDFTCWKESIPGRWGISSVKPISGFYSLHHIFDNSNSGHDQISLLHAPLALDSATTSWKFKIRHEYDPSSYNSWAVFLMSDKDALSMHTAGNCNAHIVGVNYSGSDDYVKLWKSTGNSTSELITTTCNWQTEIGTKNAAEIEVVRRRNGKWEIWICLADSLSERIMIGETTDTTGLKISNFFGLYYNYSSAQDRKLWFDDLEIDGYFIQDTFPPKLIGIDAPNQRHIVLHCNENIVFLSNTQLKITASSVNVQIDSITISENNLHVWLARAIPDESTILVKINNYADVYGNLNQSDSIGFIYYRPRFNDVVVTEIMADPSPSVLLPEVEYIEVFNRCSYPINFEGWQICVGNSSASLSSFIIHPQHYLVLCNNLYTELFRDLPEVLGIEKFPQISNSGQEIVLKDKYSNIIFSIEYSDKWYQDNIKSDGGWSLEIIDPDNPCGGRENWRASVDPKGGTPGYQNSVLSENPDYDPPELLKCVIVNDSTLYLHFNEIVTSQHLYETNTYFVDNGMGNPLMSSAESNSLNGVLLFFGKAFEDDTQYTIQIKNDIMDCSGNMMEKNFTYTFGKPTPCDSLDLIINEILFDPFTTGGDFIEIYNKSEKTIDLKGFSVALKDANTGKLSSQCLIASFPFTVEPDNYLVLTKYVYMVTGNYRYNSSANFLEMDNFPNLPNESGKIVLTGANDRIIDEVPYSQTMHAKTAVNTKGISLERTNCDLPSNQFENWYSASGDAGYATPGSVNSQDRKDEFSSFLIIVEPEIFTPDDDGYNDRTVITYTMKDIGFFATITIFDRTGRPVKKIARNTILGTSGEFLWDGKTEEGRMAPVGPYLIFTEIYNLSGTVKKFKNGCIIAEKIIR